MSLTNNIQKMLVEDAKIKRYPLSVTMELLPVCNLDCKMCYIHSSREEVEKNGGLKTIEEWLNLAEELLDNNTLFLLLTGGEVFLYPGFQELYEKLYDMGFIITINTNATMINDSIVKWLAERPPKIVSISLYGSNDEVYQKTCGVPGMFNRVDHAIKLLLENDIKVECKTVVTPLNIDDMENCWNYVKERHIPYETANYSFPPGRKISKEEQIRLNPEEAALYRVHENLALSTVEDNIKIFKELLEKVDHARCTPGCEMTGITCGGSNSSCWITWQGRMQSCAMLTEPYTMPFKNGFSNAWEELKAKCDQLHMSSKCSYCEKREICGVCPASNYTETGSYEKSSPFHCQMADVLIREAEYFLKNHL